MLNTKYVSVLECLDECSSIFQHVVIEEEAHDEMGERLMKTEEKTRSQIILVSEKVEEAKQLHLCYQVCLHLCLISEL